MENFEKIEAFLENKLSNSEKNSFLNEVKLNSKLKSELNFQKEVINGIRKARKDELKAMLSKAYIPSSIKSGSKVLYRTLAAGTATILIGSFLWYFSSFNSEKTTLPKNKTIAKTVLKTKYEHPQVETNNESSKKTQPNKKIKKKKVDKVKTVSPQIITPKPPNSDDVFENKDLSEENLEIPDAIDKEAINLSSKINVEVKLEKEYNFHYQYSDKGIILYGRFEENLFEILELNKKGNLEIYLYYKSNYYYINNKSGVITPLELINNEDIKNKLSRLRQ